LPTGLTRLNSLDLENNQLTSFNLPSNLTSLVSLDLGFNSFANFSLPGGLTNLTTFYFAGNPLTSLALPPGLAGMTELNLSQNLLTSFTLPVGMTNLIGRHEFGRRRRLSAEPRRLRFHLPSDNPVGPATNLGWSISVWNHRAAWSLRCSWLYRSRGLERVGRCDQQTWQHLFHRCGSQLLSREVLPRATTKPAREYGFHPAKYFHDGQPDQRTGP
jgi:hypothetical protein